MAAAVAVEAQPLERLEPLPAICPSCAAPVLVVELADGRDVVLEPSEVLGPPWRSPQCEVVRAKGHRRGDCLRCGGSRMLGQELPSVGAVRVDANGVGRVYRGRRADGEAVHRLHGCR